MISRFLIITLLATADVHGSSLAQDCANANTAWRKMGQSSLIPTNCCSEIYGITCSETRITGIVWSSKNLINSIPSEIGQLTGLEYLHLTTNKLNGSIPSNLGNLRNLKKLFLSRNQLSGPIPSSLGNLRSLEILALQNNQLSGRIPSSFGNMSNLRILSLFHNLLTGYPSSLLLLTKLKDRGIFPNPMSDVPYDVVRPASIALLTNVTLGPFMTTPISNRSKRQFLSTFATVSADELYQMCPLNNIQGQDVAAGCIAGIFNKFCRDPSNTGLLKKCHEAYDTVFAASFFRPLGEVCPAWKKGPNSRSCAQAIANFSHRYLLEIDPITGGGTYIDLNSSHARDLVRNILGNRMFAPCQAPFNCAWTATDA
jgi:hypothetical protein